MNERIKLLAEQAGMRECSLGYGMPENVLWGENRIENFAELIVTECMKLNSKDLSITAIERLLPLYEEHFGVEL
jgi:hypothetical protein